MPLSTAEQSRLASAAADMLAADKNGYEVVAFLTEQGVAPSDMPAIMAVAGPLANEKRRAAYAELRQFVPHRRGGIIRGLLAFFGLAIRIGIMALFAWLADLAYDAGLWPVGAGLRIGIFLVIGWAAVSLWQGLRAALQLWRFDPPPSY